MVSDKGIELILGRDMENADTLQRTAYCSHMHGVGKVGGRVEKAENYIGVALLHQCAGCRVGLWNLKVAAESFPPVGRSGLQQGEVYAESVVQSLALDESGPYAGEVEIGMVVASAMVVVHGAGPVLDQQSDANHKGEEKERYDPTAFHRF